MRNKGFLAIAVSMSVLFFAGAHAAPEVKGTAAVMDFCLFERLPRNALRNTVIPVGDDYFTSERLGLERVMRLIFTATLKKNSSYDVMPTDKVESALPAARDAFMYFVKSDKPENYFDKARLAGVAQSLGTDYLVFGLVQELKITGNGKSLEDQQVKMKISILEYEAATGAIVFSKTYEGESAKVEGLVDVELLPKRNGVVPKEISVFATSETGRVFFSLLPQMIKDLPGGEETGAFVGDGSEESGVGEPSEAGAQECSGEGLAAVVTRAGENDVIRVYPCRDGYYDFERPEMETARLAAGKWGLGSLAAGDFDGDGIDELAVSTLEPEERVVIFKMENGAFDTGAPVQEIRNAIPEMKSGARAAAGDFDGDGIDELAVTAARNGDYTVFYDGDGEIESPAGAASLYNVFGDSGFGANVAAGDFDGDGRDEIVIASDGAGEMVNVYSFSGGEDMQAELIAELRDYFGGSAKSTSVAAGDFDGDGRDELALSSIDGGVKIIVLNYEGDGFDTSVPVDDFSTYWGRDTQGVRVAAGDFDGDGRDDIALTTLGKPGRMWISQYKQNRLFHSEPYLDSAKLYGIAPKGILVAVGKFE